MQQALSTLPGFESLKNHWWALLIRGIIAVIFGVFCFFETGAAIVAVVLLIGVFFIADGALMIAGAIRSSGAGHGSQWWMLLVGGIIGIIAGLVTIVVPGLAAFTLAMFVSAWALLTGIFELLTAMRMRKHLPNDWLWVLNGLLSIALGVFIAIYPGAGLVGLTYLLGFYGLLAGFTMIGLAIRLRSLPPAAAA